MMMTRGRSSWWWIYGVCAGAVLGALAFVTRIALRLECDAFCSAERAIQQDRLRTALWRLDSYVLPILTREGARPYFEYLAYYPQERSYTRYLSPIEKGEVLLPSPLLSFAPEHVRLHFQVDAAGAFSSPQSPDGNLRDLAEATCVAIDVIPQNRSMLDQVIALVPLASVRTAISSAEAAERSLAGRWLAPGSAQRPAEPQQQGRDPVEWASRQKNAYKAKLDAANDAQIGQNLVPALDGAEEPKVLVGSLIPMWLDPAARAGGPGGSRSPELFFFRRVTVGASDLLQGVFLDWPGLERALLAEIGELMPGARLEPLRALDANWAPGDASSLA